LNSAAARRVREERERIEASIKSQEARARVLKSISL